METEILLFWSEGWHNNRHSPFLTIVYAIIIVKVNWNFFSLKIRVMLMNNTFFFENCCMDLYVEKIDKVVWGDSAYPFCDVNWGRLWLDRTSTSNTRTCRNMQVLVVNLYVSKKRFICCIFPAMSIRCVAAGVAAGGSKTTKDGVRLQSGPVRRLFQRCVANT